jgi:diaminopimelate decarboxylase
MINENRLSPRTLTQLICAHEDVLTRAMDQFGLPLHVHFYEPLAAHVAQFQNVLLAEEVPGWIALAVKSNPCRGVVRAARELSLGLDVASENELRLALEEGVPAGRIVCNGNAKSDEYLLQAIRSGCLIAVDNEDERLVVEEMASREAASVNVLTRFRGMPLSGLTSADQTTAADWTKFGFHIDEASDLLGRLAEHPLLRVRGVSAHIGTQITEPRGYECLLERLLSLTEEARRYGHVADLIDLGGGFPVSFFPEPIWRSFQQRLRARLRSKTSPSVTWNDLPMGYEGQDPSLDEWVGKAYWSSLPQAQMFSHVLHHRGSDGRTGLDRLRNLSPLSLIVEPGRSLLASSGITLTEVRGVKQVLGHWVVSLDMGINNHGTNLICPDMFPAAVLPERQDDVPVEAFLAGRLCFSGDMVSKSLVSLNRLPKRGDLLVIFHTGAYSADHFASNSCGFLRPGKVAIRADGTLECWRRPESFEEIFGASDVDLTV